MNRSWVNRETTICDQRGQLRSPRVWLQPVKWSMPGMTNLAARYPMSTEKTVLNQSRSVQNSRRRKGCVSYGKRRSRAIIRNAQRTMRTVGSNLPGVINGNPPAQQLSHPSGGLPGRRLDVGLVAGERGVVSL